MRLSAFPTHLPGFRHYRAVIVAMRSAGASLVVQCLGLFASTAGDKGSIPGRGTGIPCAVRCGQKYLKRNAGSDEHLCVI